MEYLARFVLYLLLTFVLPTCGVYCLFRRLLPRDEVPDVRLAGLVLPLGPCVVSLLLYGLYWVAPGRGLGLYASVIGAALLASVASNFRALPLLAGELASAMSSIRLSRWGWFMMGLEGVFFFGLCLVVLLYPQFANDPLSYLTQGRFFAAERAGGIYPFLNHASGYYAHSQHPPFFSVLLSWAYLFQGHTESSYFGKFITMHFVFCSLMAPHAFRFFKTVNFNVLFGLFLLGTPLMTSMVVVGHVDVIRSCVYLYGAVWAGLLFEGTSLGRLAAVGIALGFASRVHATCLVVPVFVLGAYVLFAWQPFLHKVKAASMVAAFVFLVSGWDYGYLMSLYGGLGLRTEEALSLYQIKSLHYGEYVKITRGIATLPDLVVNGLLRGFSSFTKYSLSYWFMLAGVLMNLRGMASREKLFLAQVGFFFLLMAVTVSMGNVILVKNSRYLMMVQPFVAYFAVMFFESAYAKLRHT